MSSERLKVKTLTSSNFEAFGEVIETEDRASFMINNGMAERFHALAHVGLGGDNAQAIISIVHSQKFALPRLVDHVEHHPFGSQAFIPLDEIPFIVVVGKAGVAPAVADLNAFITNGKQGINYHLGTWHHVLLTPYAAIRFLCVDRSGSGNNCIDHFYPEDEQLELNIPAIL